MQKKTLSGEYAQSNKSTAYFVLYLNLKPKTSIEKSIG